MKKTQAISNSKRSRPRVKITSAIIERSEPRNSGHCMIAEAIAEALPDAKRIAVDLATIRFTMDDKRFVYLTPRSAQTALVDFDLGVHTEPFEFELRNANVKPIGHKKKAAITPSYGGNSVTRSGGSVPPVGALPSGSTGRRRTGHGMRRAFGLRDLQR